MYFFFYALLIAAVFIFSGIGLTILIIPRVFVKYSLFFSPFVGLAYLCYCSWFFFEYSPWGAVQYAKFLLVPPLFFLIIAGIVKKERIATILFPFKKENVPSLILCGILFLSISYPYYSNIEGISNTISLGNNDIIDYASTSKYLTTSSISHPAILSPFDSSHPSLLRFPLALQHYYFGSYVATAIPSSYLSLETYQIENLTLYLFFVFMVPIIFIICIEIFLYSKNFALFAALITGINFNLLYIVYDGFLGQVIGIGFFFCLFFMMFYPLIHYEKKSDLYSHLPICILLVYGVCMSYQFILPFIYLSLGIFLFVNFIKYSNKIRTIHSICFIGLAFLFSIIISPFAIIDRLFQIVTVAKNTGGLNIPFMYPDGAMGMNTQHLLKQPNIPILSIALSAVAVILITVSCYQMYKDDFRLFSAAFSSIALVFFLYTYFTIQEALSPSFSGDSYRAFKTMTYFIPIIVISALYYMKDIRLSSITLSSNAKKRLFLGLVLILLMGNLYSAYTIITFASQQSKRISSDCIDLGRVHSIPGISSINVEERSYWTQMWIYYFLMGTRPIYLKYSTYWNATRLEGEWTLRTDLDVIHSTIRNDPLIINNGFYLEKNSNFNAAFHEGWYDLSSNAMDQWRWTGAESKSPSIIVNLKQARTIDLDLTYWCLDPANELTILVDNATVQGCTDGYQCKVSHIDLSEGTHIMTFRPKLPPRPPRDRDPNYLSYAFTNITFSPSPS